MTCLIFAQGQIGGWGAGGWGQGGWGQGGWGGIGMPWNTGVTQWGNNLPWTRNPWQNSWGNLGVNPFPNQGWGTWGNLGNVGYPWGGQRAFFKK